MMVACQPWPTGRPCLKISEPDGSPTPETTPDGSPTPETTPDPELSLALSERERAWSERVYRDPC
jgi:hypothetical protein